MKKIFTILLLLLNGWAFAQVSNTATLDTAGGTRVGAITVGGYLDLYAGHYTGKAADGNIPYFVSAARNGEITANLAYIDLRYNAERLRARLVPGFGTYMNANYAAEPGSLKNLVEASLGVKLWKKRDIWLELGVFGSPYTNESAISKDHLMYTRSFAPEYVPYYLAGAKLALPLSKKLTAYLYLLNGWQQIQDANKGKSLGTQLEWRPNGSHLFNWNTYIGDERSIAAPNNRTRYFTDVYWIYGKGNWATTACAYIGWQERLDAQGKIQNHAWWQANAMAKYSFNSKYSLSGRVEYFSDPESVQITPINPVSGFASFSTGLCFNIKIDEHALWRVEARRFLAKESIYQSKEGQPETSATWLVSSVALWF